jgi:hypothetical protein
MTILKAIYYFHLKLFIPSLILGIIAGSLGWMEHDHFSIQKMAFGYWITSLLFHLFIYEVDRKKEYIFYYNLGLSKLVLWISTFVIGLSLYLISLLL